MHDHAHGHVHAHHAPMTAVLKYSMVVTLAFVVAEFTAGYLAHSLALISDAVHNLTDIPTLALSWLALLWSERAPTSEKTFGYHRAGILAAFVNALLLVLVALYIFYEAFERLAHPLDVRPGLMAWLALVGLAVNGGISLALVRGRRDLNLRSMLIHNAGDALSNLAVLVGAAAIAATRSPWVDPVIGIGIGALVLWSSAGILNETTHILLEGMPRQMRLEDVARSILRVEGVREVHDIHIWTLGTDRHALSCHVRIPDMHMDQSELILARIREHLARDFHIEHTTIQFERAGLPGSAELFMPGSPPPEKS